MTPRRARSLRMFLANLVILAIGALALVASQWKPAQGVVKINVEVEPSVLFLVAGALAVAIVLLNTIAAILRQLARSTSRYYHYNDALWPVRGKRIIAFPLCAKCRVRMEPVRQLYMRNESHWRCPACEGTVPMQSATGRSILYEAREQPARDRRRFTRRHFKRARRRVFVAQDVAPHR